VPPITSTSPNLPETPDEISLELRKQESLLSQIHSEMNAGFVTPKREEELWETQRIITQLKVIFVHYAIVRGHKNFISIAKIANV
jgi:RalA-binding protein 1